MAGRGKVLTISVRLVLLSLLFGFAIVLSSLWLLADSVRAAEQELSYDDGGAEFYFGCSLNCVAAVKFTVSDRSQILRLRYGVQGEENAVRVHVLDANFNSIYSQQVMPHSGWLEIDISRENVYVSGDFFVGLQWIIESPNGPWLGDDNSSPPQQRSYLGAPGSSPGLAPIANEHYLIHAIVQSGVPIPSLPDLAISDSDISVSVSDTTSGQQKADVWATVRNIGQADANDVQVLFELVACSCGTNVCNRDPNSANPISGTSIPAGSQKSVGAEFYYSPQAGFYRKVTVKADWQNVIPESNENNNEASKTISSCEEQHQITANFSYSPLQPKVGDTIQFTDESQDPNGTITSWTWEFGDGSTSSVRNPAHSYAVARTYSVCLTVADNYGATDKACRDITVGESGGGGTGKKILWAGMGFSSCGVAGEGQFSCAWFKKELERLEYSVDSTAPSGPGKPGIKIDLKTLRNYKVFVFSGSPGLSGFLPDIQDYVAEGGSLVILHDSGWAGTSNGYVLAQAFGVDIAPYSQVRDPQYHLGDHCLQVYPPLTQWKPESCPLIEKRWMKDHPITQGVDQIYLGGPTYIRDKGTSTVIAETSDQSTLYPSSNEVRKGPLAVLSFLENTNGGKVVVLTDSNVFSNQLLYEGDNLQLGLNIINWLAERTGGINPIVGLPPPAPPSSGGNRASIKQFDTNNNDVLDNDEFFAITDAWITGQLDDPTYFEAIDLWVSQQPISSAGVSSEPVRPNSVLFQMSRAERTITFSAQGHGVASVGVEIFDSAGTRVFTREATGTRIKWDFNSSESQRLANGVYFYVITARAPGDRILRSEVKKLIMLR